MSGRGRRAVLPPPGEVPARPPILHTDTMVVEHRDADGKVVRYDFDQLPGAPGLKRSLAEVFAARCAPSGGWASHKTSEQAWWALRQFVSFLAGQDDAPSDLEALTASSWKRWRLSRPSGTSGRAHCELSRRCCGNTRMFRSRRGS